MSDNAFLYAAQADDKAMIQPDADFGMNEWFEETGEQITIKC